MKKAFIIIIVFTALSSTALGVINFKYPEIADNIVLFPEKYAQIAVTAIEETDQQSASAEKKNEVSMIAVGDIMLSRVVDKKMKDNKNYEYPFLKISDFLQSSDFNFGNLETAITPGRQIKTGEMTFRADPEVLEVLKKMKFEILSLANNHTPNFNEKGLNDTFEYMEQAGINYVGAGKNYEEAYKPAYIEKNKIKFAFLAYNDTDAIPKSYCAKESRPGTACMNINKMEEDVKKAKENSDIVIISMHSGIEYAPNPSKRQKEFARAAIDAGASLVIGHHPHVIQSMEKYNGKYIFYSLGNFIFDQMWSIPTKQGLAIKIIFNKTDVEKIELHPILIEDYSQPKILEGSAKDSILKRIKIENSP